MSASSLFGNSRNAEAKEDRFHILQTAQAIDLTITEENKPNRNLIPLHVRSSTSTFLSAIQVLGDPPSSGGNAMSFKLTVNGQPATVDVPADMPVVGRSGRQSRGTKYGAACRMQRLRFILTAQPQILHHADLQRGGKAITIRRFRRWQPPVQQAWMDDVSQCGLSARPDHVGGGAVGEACSSERYPNRYSDEQHLSPGPICASVKRFTKLR
jgi:hypothetical protein